MKWVNIILIHLFVLLHISACQNTSDPEPADQVNDNNIIPVNINNLWVYKRMSDGQLCTLKIEEQSISGWEYLPKVYHRVDFQTKTYKVSNDDKISLLNFADIYDNTEFRGIAVTDSGLFLGYQIQCSTFTQEGNCYSPQLFIPRSHQHSDNGVYKYPVYSISYFEDEYEKNVYAYWVQKENYTSYVDTFDSIHELNVYDQYLVSILRFVKGIGIVEMEMRNGMNLQEKYELIEYNIQ